MDEKCRMSSEMISIGKDQRWALAAFACLEKNVDLAKAPCFTKEMAETIWVLSKTAKNLETTNETPPD